MDSPADQRNISAHQALQPDMVQELSAHNLSWRPLGGQERMTLAGSHAAPVHALAQEEVLLVERARGGDQDAFGVLVRLHQRQVYMLALRMLHDSEEASEATQEVFLAAWQGLRSFRGDARFNTWLYRIAYNHCLKVVEHQRRDSVARAELAAQSAREHSPAGALSTQHADAAVSAMRERVRGEIAGLPPKYRAVLVLRHLQDLSYEEMAEVMRMPIGTVKTQLFRARALLKERLEALGRVRDEGVARAGELRAELGSGLLGMLERTRDVSQVELGEESE